MLLIESAAAAGYLKNAFAIALTKHAHCLHVSNWHHWPKQCAVQSSFIKLFLMPSHKCYFNSSTTNQPSISLTADICLPQEYVCEVQVSNPLFLAVWGVMKIATEPTFLHCGVLLVRIGLGRPPWTTWKSQVTSSSWMASIIVNSLGGVCFVCSSREDWTSPTVFFLSVTTNYGCCSILWHRWPHNFEGPIHEPLKRCGGQAIMQIIVITWISKYTRSDIAALLAVLLQGSTLYHTWYSKNNYQDFLYH